MVTDNGGAPCVEDGLLSLTICKPKIRSTCEEKDTIFGFGSNSIDAPLIYIAEITEKHDKGQYFIKYSHRKDSIYKRKGDRYIWRKDKKYHYEEYLEHDLGKHEKRYPYAIGLLSNKFRYFGHKASDEYKKRFPKVRKLVESLTRGHRVNHTKETHNQLLQLKKDIFRKFTRKVNGKPRDLNRYGRCSEDDGDICIKC
jgi:hypothetical protein